jgi:NAD(P)H-dependent FMN reductase
VKIVTFAGALRAESVSKRLVREAANLLRAGHGVEADAIDLKDYPFPVYDTDTEHTIGIPDSIIALAQRIATANALIVASPEYNSGISSVLKTLVDWLSRVKPMPLSGKFLLLLSASPSGSGGVLGLSHTRAPFDHLGVHVFPQMVAVPRSHGAFDAEGALVDEKARRKLAEAVAAFVAHVEHHHPIAREVIAGPRRQIA